MKEHYIPFIKPMVLAIQDRVKTETRRVIDPQPVWVADAGVPFKTTDADPNGIIKCPYGRPNHVLLVKEALVKDPATGLAAYEADGVLTGEKWRWKRDRLPSIFMPVALVRTRLLVTRVEPEPLNEITEAGARAEGIVDGGCLNCGNPEPCHCPDPKPDARDAYIGLWDSLNAKRGYPWSSNPWVWVVGFEVIEAHAGRVNDSQTEGWVKVIRGM